MARARADRERKQGIRFRGPGERAAGAAAAAVGLNYTPCESASRESSCGTWIYSMGKAGDETKMTDLFSRRARIYVLGGSAGGGEVHADMMNINARRREEEGASAVQPENSRGREEKVKYEEGEVWLFLLHHCTRIHVKLPTFSFSLRLSF